MTRRGLVRCGTVLTTVVLTGCGTWGGSADPSENSVGMGVPQRGAQEFAEAPRTVTTRVHVGARGCFLGSLADGSGSRHLVLWPAGTEQGRSGDELVLPDGATVRDGDVLEGAGTVVPVRELEGFGEGGYWDHAVGYCTPEASEVLVLDTVRAAGPGGRR